MSAHLWLTFVAEFRAGTVRPFLVCGRQDVGERRAVYEFQEVQRNSNASSAVNPHLFTPSDQERSEKLQFRSVWSLSMASYVFHSRGVQRTRQRSSSSMKLVTQTESAPRINSRNTGGIVSRPLSSLIRSATNVAGESGFSTVELRLASRGHAGNLNR